MQIKKIPILALFVIVFFAAGVFALDAQLWNAPLLPDAVVVWQDQPVAVSDVDARATLMRTKMTTADILDFYEKVFVSQGWKIKDVFSESNITAFTKDNTYMYVGVRELGRDSGRDVYLVSSPGDLAICRIMAVNMAQDGLITEDVPGRDLVDVPRYPASKRMINIFSPQEGNSLMYQAQASVDEIARFYQNSLKPQGWKLVNVVDPSHPKLKKKLPDEADVDIGDFKNMEFEKGKGLLSIGIYSMGKAKKLCLITVLQYKAQTLNNM